MNRAEPQPAMAAADRRMAKRASEQRSPRRITLTDLSDLELAMLTRRLARYYEQDDAPNGFGWLAAEARMFEKLCEEEGVSIPEESDPLSEAALYAHLGSIAESLAVYYGRSGAPTWAHRLADEARRLHRRSGELDETTDRWFHHPEMERRVAEAEADFRAGRSSSTFTLDEAQAHLDRLKGGAEKRPGSERGVDA
jgi:hypothetical protein